MTIPLGRGAQRDLKLTRSILEPNLVLDYSRIKVTKAVYAS